MEDNIIDYGQVTVPTDWSQVTLKQYEKIEEYYDGDEKKFNIIDVLDIFINKTKDYIMSLPAEFLEKIIDKMSFINEQPKVDKPTNKIEIDGETYIINVMEKLKTGEYIAADTALKANRHDYASLLAILCRKEGEAYDSKFEAELFQKRKEMFEQQPITKILPLVSYFLQCYIISAIPTLLSMKLEEEINRTANSIETLQKNGEISKHCMKSLTKKLRKLKKSISSI